MLPDYVFKNKVLMMNELSQIAGDNKLVDFALKQIHYPQEYNLSLNSIDKNILTTMMLTEKSKLSFGSITAGLQPVWRLAAIYQLYELLYATETTIIVAAESLHLAKKAYQTLLFPLNHISRELIPELKTKTSHTISFSNDCEVKIWYPEMVLTEVQNKRVLVFSHNIEAADFKQEKTVCLGGVCGG